MRWTLGADEEVLSFSKSDPGNVDLPPALRSPCPIALETLEVWCRQASLDHARGTEFEGK